MSSPSIIFDKSGWELGKSAAKNSISRAKVVTSIENFKYNNDGRDHKIADYLLLGILSIFAHNSIVGYFEGASFGQEIVVPEKPKKVEITISKPKPKTIIQPPPPPPPPPKVAKKLPPKTPKAKANVVPLKPQIVDKVEYVAELPKTAEPVINVPAAPVAVPVVEEKVTPPVAGADYLNNPAPEYPELAMERGWEGKVLLKVHVQPDGKPDSVSVAKSSGQKVLDDAAIKTVYKWSFVPAKRGDTPIAGTVTVPMNFKL